MYTKSYKKGDIILNEGIHGNKFYIIRSGTIDVIQHNDDDDPDLYKSYGTGDKFNEIMLFQDKISEYTYKVADNDTSLWILSRQEYRKIIRTHRSKNFQERIHFLKGTSLLCHLPHNDMNQIAEALEEVEYNKGDDIVIQGHDGDEFYLLVNGTAVATIDNNIVKSYGTKGDFFGERSLLTEEKRAATITATSKIKLLALKRKDFKALLGDLSALNLEEEYKLALDQITPTVKKNNMTIRPSIIDGNFAGSIRPSIWDENLVATGQKGKSLLPSNFQIDDSENLTSSDDDDDDTFINKNQAAPSSSSSTMISQQQKKIKKLHHHQLV